jgi:cell division septum initiation protein DivIVA
MKPKPTNPNPLSGSVPEEDAMSGGDKDGAQDLRAVQTKVRELRSASFSPSRKGFDRDEVMTYLHRLAGWLEGAGLADPEEVKRELAMVGQRTSEILTKADETANALRADAQRTAGEVLESAQAEAERMRTEAEEEARRTRLDAKARAEETVDEADRSAEQMIEGAMKRRQDLEVLIDDLVAGRDEILADTRRLVDEMSQLVGRGAELEPEEGESEEEEEEQPPAEAARAEFDELDEDGIGPAELDGDPDFSHRDAREEPGATSEQDPLEPDTREQSPERASRGAS